MQQILPEGLILNQETDFSLEEYLGRLKSSEKSGNEQNSFKNVCAIIEELFEREWEHTDEIAKSIKLEREKRAIMGYESEMNYYKEKIKEMLINLKLTDVKPPNWFPNLSEAIFAELYGLSGLAPWAYDMESKYEKSPSAKLIGDRLYCLIDGKEVLQPQKIPLERRNKLKRALLMATPAERTEYGYHEVYLRNGIRITIYSGSRTKEQQDIMVFRKYILKKLDFDSLIEYGTIPGSAKPIFLKMIEIGFNVIFAGRVRSGKTTMLQIWQCCEDKSLEGVAVATDPETKWHILMPEAPIMQLIADGDELELVAKSLLRGDNDYILLEEMRDAAAFKLALDITSTGTVRSKATIHDNDGISVPYKMASKIVQKYGGRINPVIAQIYSNFDYVIELCQHPYDPKRKVVKGIVEYSYDKMRDEVYGDYICRYDFDSDCWLWRTHMAEEKYEKFSGLGKEIKELENMLKKLETTNPAVIKNPELWSISPSYYEKRVEYV